MNGGEQIGCAYCDKVSLSKDEVGLNKKLFHPQIERMLCITCMADYLEITRDELAEMIEKFRRQGCELFG